MRTTNLSGYFLWTTGAVMAGALTFWLAGRALPTGMRGRTLALALLLGLIGARAFYVLSRMQFFLEIGGTVWLWPFDPVWGDWGVGLGFALWGAVGGTALAGLIACEKKYRAGMMDALAKGGCMAIGLYRFGEFLIGEGTGPMIETEVLQFFPLAVVNEWGEWNGAVFFWEGIAALSIFVLLMVGRRRREPGDTARVFLILFSSCQILLESLRRDSFLRWMFVRVSQVTAALILACLMAAAIIRIKKNPDIWARRKREIFTCYGFFLLCTGICIGLEFAMDKSAFLSLEVCYGLEALCCLGLGGSAYRVSIPAVVNQTSGYEKNALFRGK